MKKKRIIVPVYNVPIEIYAGTLKELNEELYKLNLPILNWYNSGITFFQKDVGKPRMFFRTDLKFMRPGEIVHECGHMVDFVFDFIGCNAANVDPEPRAYLLEYITNRVFYILGSSGVNILITKS